MKHLSIIKIGVCLTTITLMTNCVSPSSEDDNSHLRSPQGIEEDSIVKPVAEVTTLPLDSFFTPIDTSFTHNTLWIPEGFQAQVLFTEKLSLVTRADGVTSPAKGNHDMLAYLPNEKSQNQGWLFVSHETKYADSILGDGGGATMFEVEQDSLGQWNRRSEFEHVDFRHIGNTERNCGGTVGPNGMIYTCEEYQPKNNATVYRNGKGHLTTDSVGNLDYWENIGYVVEIDPKTRKATQKMIGMGRYFHEDLEFMDDQKTVYLSDDYEPCVFFKFVADYPLDYAKGQLYAYKQSEDGASGEWLSLPRDTATMIRARDVAIELGASMFMRHEWIARVGNKLYIGETGHDETNWSNRLAQGGIPAYHLENYHRFEGNIFKDVTGRILVFDTETDIMSIHLEGGLAKDGKTYFSNPDCISPATIGGKECLIIHEDLNGHDKGRVPDHAHRKNRFYNELYFLDLSISNPTLEDLKRFAIAPIGAEFTGGIMSPDGSTLFLNIQHPFWSNEKPYNKSMTVAITGWDKR